MKMTLAKIFLFAICVTLSSAAEWDYDATGSKGPNNWGGVCPTGKSQSPIDIVLDDASTDVSLGTFNFVNYNAANKYSLIKNNGHTIQVDMVDGSVKISGGGLVDNTYTLAQFHLHWGNTSATGSEHYIDGMQTPLEIHFVHYNDIYTNILDALNETNGLAVLGFLFEIQDEDNTNLNFFIDSITNVMNKDDQYTGAIGSEPALKTIFHNVDLTRFVRYSGSLTTPNCYESVQWTVFTNKIKISESQMDKIRNSYLDAGTTKIGLNYRPLQPLESRVVKITYSIHWDYDTSSSHGPSNWGGVCSSGTKQSPINIKTITTKVKEMAAFSFTNYDQTMKYGTLKNNGHTVQVDMADDTLKISGGGLLAGTYTLAQFHFHWGIDSSKGSEHLIDDMQAPLEIHLVHYKDEHGDLSTAATLPDGLAVLGFLFKIQAEDNTNLTFFIDQITNVANKGQSYTSNLGSEPEVQNIFKNVDMSKFYRYSGSLTTPGCYESVQWTVFTDKIPISEAQMNKIRATYMDSSGTANRIGKNYRPVQPVNTREVYISYDPNTSAASGLVHNIMFLILSLTFSFLF